MPAFATTDNGCPVTVIETAKLNGLGPQARLAHILHCIPDHKINRIDKLLPRNCTLRSFPTVTAKLPAVVTNDLRPFCTLD